MLPSGETVSVVTCDTAGTEYWAAGKATKSGASTVFFLRSSGTKWTVVPTGSVCGAASAGLPQKILDYCNGWSPSP